MIVNIELDEKDAERLKEFVSYGSRDVMRQIHLTPECEYAKAFGDVNQAYRTITQAIDKAIRRAGRNPLLFKEFKL